MPNEEAALYDTHSTTDLEDLRSRVARVDNDYPPHFMPRGG
jgi:hypothetical protein